MRVMSHLSITKEESFFRIRPMARGRKRKQLIGAWNIISPFLPSVSIMREVVAPKFTPPSLSTVPLSGRNLVKIFADHLSRILAQCIKEYYSRRVKHRTTDNLVYLISGSFISFGWDFATEDNLIDHRTDDALVVLNNREKKTAIASKSTH